MDPDVVVPIAVGLPTVLALFIGLPWLILHYVLGWRRARSLSIEDEQLLDNLHETARRLDERLHSIERIIAAENPRWREQMLGGPVDRKDLTDVRSSY